MHLAFPNESQIPVEIIVKRKWTIFFVADPSLEAVESQRFEVFVELVGEELLPLDKHWKVSYAEDADVVDHLPSTTSIVPIGVHRQPRLITRVTCTSNLSPRWC